MTRVTLGEAHVVFVLLVLLVGCIGINPAWDQDPRESEGGEPTSSAESSSSPGADEASGGSLGGESSGSSTGNADGQSSTTTEPPACEGPGLVVCESQGEWVCVDPSRDDEHCGGCSHDCTLYGEASCRAGECICMGSQQLCADQCVDPRDDPSACGEECVDCLKMLGESAQCEHGKCKPWL